MDVVQTSDLSTYTCMSTFIRSLCVGFLPRPLIQLNNTKYKTFPSTRYFIARIWFFFGKAAWFAALPLVIMHARRDVLSGLLYVGSTMELCSWKVVVGRPSRFSFSAFQICFFNIDERDRRRPLRRPLLSHLKHVQPSLVLPHPEYIHVSLYSWVCGIR